jgi:hypothetical protein
VQVRGPRRFKIAAMADAKSRKLPPKEREEFARRVAELRLEIEKKHGQLPDSTDLIREIRDERG